MYTCRNSARTQKLDERDAPRGPDADVVDERADVFVVSLWNTYSGQSPELVVECPACRASALDEAVDSRQLGQSNAGVDIGHVVAEAFTNDVILPRALVLVAFGCLLVDAQKSILAQARQFFG